MFSPSPWSAKILAHRVIDKDRSGRSYPRHNVADCANRQCRNILGFDDIGDETHGLVAVRSVGYEYSQMHALPRQLTRQDWGQLFFDFPVETNPTVDRKMKRGHATDKTLIGKRPQRPSGKDGFRVLAGSGAKGRSVIDLQVRDCGIGGYPPIAHIPYTRKRPLTSLTDSSAGDERYTHFVQGT